MRAKTFLEIHHALLNKEPLEQEGAIKRGLYNGLCGVWLNGKPLPSNKIFRLFIPYNGIAYWADEGNPFDWGENYNDLRQNIILLCAAINGEL